MGHVKAPDIPPPYRRYTLHYVHHVIIKSDWWTDTAPRWESIDFKTLNEAKEYLSIAGDNAYIIDNVTKSVSHPNNKKITNMANLKLRIKKTILKKKLDGVTVTGYYGRVLTNGTFERFPLIGKAA